MGMLGGLQPSEAIEFVPAPLIESHRFTMTGVPSQPFGVCVLLGSTQAPVNTQRPFGSCFLNP